MAKIRDGVIEDQRTLDQIYIVDGYHAAKAEADLRNVVWFASAGARRSVRETAPIVMTWTKPMEGA